MKNFIKAALALVVVFAFGCGNQNSAENSVKQFFTLIKNKDYEKAKEFGTKQSGESVDEIKNAAGGSNFDIKSLIDPKEVTCKEDTSKSTSQDTLKVTSRKKCEVCCDGNGKKKTVKVVEVNGKWLVDMNKKEIKNGAPDMKGLEDSMKDMGDKLKDGLEDGSKMIDTTKKELEKQLKDKKDEKKK